MKNSIAAGFVMFLVGLAAGYTLHSPSESSPPQAAKAENTATPTLKYGTMGAAKKATEKDFLPEDAYKSYIVGDDGKPRSFEQFKDLLAKSKMVNANAPSFQQEALLVYAAALVRAFGPNAINEITQSPLLANFGPAAPGMLQMMYDHHGRDAAMKLIASYSNQQIKSMLYGMVASRLMENNYVEAVDFARQHAPMKLKEPAFISDWVKSAGKNLDETGLLGLVLSFDSAQARIAAAETAGVMLWSPDPNGVKSTLANLVSVKDAVLRNALLDSYLSRAVTVNPELLLNPAFTGIKIHQNHFRTAAEFMIGKGWDEAMLMGLKIASDENRHVYQMALVDATVNSGDNATALNYSIKAYNEGIDDGQMMSRAVSAVARYSPKDAAEFLSRPTLPTEVKEALMVETMRDIATGDLEQAKKLMRTSQLSEPTRDRIYADMATHLARENPETALSETLSVIRDPMYRASATNDVAQEFFRNDSQACLNWLQRVPVGLERDQLTSAIANEMIKTDVRGAINIATQVSDANRQLSTVSVIYGNARYLQPALAEAWAKENPEWIRRIHEAENLAPAP
jgi:hypothetical protein